MATSSELEPTSIEVVARSGVEGLAVDSGGDVWLHGPWMVTRVDPGTGASSVWDVSDDLAFSEVIGLRPSQEDGVWIVAQDRLRLFDGVRFVHDMPVPEQYRGGPGGVITDMVEVGTEVWVSSAAGVARCAGGAWSSVGPQQLTRTTSLEVDAEGSVWAAGRLLQEGGAARAVVRFDGVRWQLASPNAESGFVDELVADGSGGMLVRYGYRVRRFDGSSWSLLPPYYSGRSVAIGASEDGDVWLLGEGALVRFEGSGRWRKVAEVPEAVGIAVVDGQVMVADSRGLVRVEGEDVSRILVARSGLVGLAPAVDSDPDEVARRLLFVASDEVWSLDYSVAARFRGGSRRVEVLPSPASWPTSPVLASDGAVWVAAQEGLVRLTADAAELIRVIPPGRFLYPGPEGSVWIHPDPWFGWWYAGQYANGKPLDARTVRRVWPDGRQTSIRLPTDVWTVTAMFPAADGSLWATSCETSGEPEECRGAAGLMRWADGQWSMVPYPGSGVVGVGVAGDTFWALVRSDDDAVAPPVVGRYSQGAWTMFPEAGWLESVAVAPQGSLCGLAADGPTLVCIDGTGRITRTPLGVRGELRIAGDGSVWLVAPGLVARLPMTVPK